MLSGGEFNYKRGFRAPRHRRVRPLGHQGVHRRLLPELRQVQGPGRTREEAVQRRHPPGLRERELHQRRRSTTTRIATRSIAPPARPTSTRSAATTTTSTSCTRDAPTSRRRRQRQRAARRDAFRRAAARRRQPANPSSCTNYFGVRINPSNTGNVRMQSLWHLGEKLRLTFDPSYQYVLGERRRHHADHRDRRHHRRRRVRVGNSNAPGCRPQRRRRPARHRAFLYAQHHQHQSLWRHRLADLGSQRRQPRCASPTPTITPSIARPPSGATMDLDDGRSRTCSPAARASASYAADGDIIRGRDRLLGRRAAASSRSSIAASSSTTSSPPRVGVRAPYFKRELNQYCYTPNGGNGSSGTIEPPAAARCAPRARH